MFYRVSLCSVFLCIYCVMGRAAWNKLHDVDRDLIWVSLFRATCVQLAWTVTRSVIRIVLPTVMSTVIKVL